MATTRNENIINSSRLDGFEKNALIKGWKSKATSTPNPKGPSLVKTCI
jgi:hypothetical protein